MSLIALNTGSKNSLATRYIHGKIPAANMYWYDAPCQNPIKIQSINIAKIVGIFFPIFFPNFSLQYVKYPLTNKIEVDKSLLKEALDKGNDLYKQFYK